jgi:hypothetical protein
MEVSAGKLKESQSDTLGQPQQPRVFLPVLWKPINEARSAIGKAIRLSVARTLLLRV